MKAKSTATLGIAALQVASQAFGAWRAHEQQKETKPVAKAQAVKERVATGAEQAMHAAQDRIDQMIPSRRRQAEQEHRQQMMLIIVGAVAAIAAVAAFFAHRRPVQVPSPIAVAKERLAEGDVKHAVTDAALQTGVAVASGASLTKAAAVETVKVAADEKVITPAKQAAIKWGSITAAALAALVLLVAVIGSALGTWLYQSLAG